MKKGKKQSVFSLSAIVLALAMVFSAALSAPATGIASKDISTVRLTVGGEPFGARMKTEGVLVVGCGNFTSGGESRSPAKDAGIEKGDIIVKMNDLEVDSVEEAVTVIENCSGMEVSVLVKRSKEEKELKLLPLIADEDGLYKAGLWIKDGSAGIGTVTYIDPETLEFAGLGHGITDAETELLLPFKEGSVENVMLESLVKGEEGKPGELRGNFTGKTVGTLTANAEVGVFGILNEHQPEGETMLVATSSEVVDGEAKIVSTLDDEGRKYYDIMISDINRSGELTKSFMITVTDPDLIAKSGGIIQGMSGSPVVQNGKLIGAVTHVLVNNPTKGYGIFVENMIKQTPDLVN